MKKFTSIQVDRNRKRRHRRGSTLVQMVFAFPLMIWILFAIIQYAMIWNAEQTLNDLARQCARFAAVNYMHSSDFNTSTSDVKSIQYFLKQQCAATNGLINYDQLPNCPDGGQQPCVYTDQTGSWAALTRSTTTDALTPVDIKIYNYPMSTKILVNGLVPGISYFNTTVTYDQTMITELNK